MRRTIIVQMDSKICPRCFTRSESRGACETCGYAAWRSRLHLLFGLAGCLLALLALTLGAVFTYYYGGYHL